MENKFNTDEQLRNSLRDFEAIPDNGSFDAILEKMNRKKKRRFFMTFFWTGLIALSGIAIPLIFKFYGTEKPSALTVAKTHSGSSAQHTASTHTTTASVTHADIHTTQASPSSPENPSTSETISPKAKAGTAIPDQDPMDVIPSGTQASLTKHASAKTSFKNKDQQQALYAGKKPETKDKNVSKTNSVEKATKTTTPETSQNIETIPGSVDKIEAMYMSVIQIPMPVDSIQPDVSASLQKGSYTTPYLGAEKKHPFSFYIGVQASPQLNSFALSKNPNRNSVYNSVDINFPDFYLNIKKDQRHFNFSVPFGIKAGVRINNTYEVFAGFGIQSFSEQEKLYAVSPTTITAIPDPGMVYNSSPHSMPTKNRFRYLCYSLEANRLFISGKAIGFKLGLGLYGNQLTNSSYLFVKSPNNYGKAFLNREKLSPWLLITKIKAGVIFHANRRFQLHISPGFFYSPTSVFKKDYVIRQKPFGVDVECLMLFRLFKF